MPGNLAELRPLIVAISFMAVFFLLVAIIPTQFLPSAITNGTQVNGFVNVNGYTFLIANDSTFLNVSGALYHGINQQLFTAGGWSVGLINYPLGRIPLMLLATYKDLYGVKGDVSYFTWYYQNMTMASDTAANQNSPSLADSLPLDFKAPGEDPVFMSVDALNTEYSAGHVLSFMVKNDKTKATVTFEFNQTKWAFPSAAYVNDELKMSIFVDYNDRASGFSALDLIFGFLTFQEIPDIDANISRIIAIPVWISVAYLIYIFIIKTIGAIFGGG